jgi:hypothetical protein
VITASTIMPDITNAVEIKLNGYIAHAVSA